MAMVTTKEMLLKAQKEGYAVGAFNAENMEMVQAVIEAAEQMQAPVIIQTTPGTLKYADPEMLLVLIFYFIIPILRRQLCRHHCLMLLLQYLQIPLLYKQDGLLPFLLIHLKLYILIWILLLR